MFDENLLLNWYEDFMVWMCIVVFFMFCKIYGCIEIDLVFGMRLIVNINNFYNMYGFGGSKKFVLFIVSWVGGRNDFLGLLYVVVGCVCIFIGLMFMYLYWKYLWFLGDRFYFFWVWKNVVNFRVMS